MMPRASLLISSKYVLASGDIIQIRVWRLPVADTDRPHGLKYSLFYGRPGERIVAYDNETGKGDHKYYGEREEKYLFTTLEQLIQDFQYDVRQESDNEIR